MRLLSEPDTQHLKEAVEPAYNLWLSCDGNNISVDISSDAISYNDDGTIAAVIFDVYLQVPNYNDTYIIEFGWHADSGKFIGLYYEKAPSDWHELEILEEPSCTAYDLDSLIDFVIAWIVTVGFALKHNLLK